MPQMLLRNEINRKNERMPEMQIILLLEMLHSIEESRRTMLVSMQVVLATELIQRNRTRVAVHLHAEHVRIMPHPYS